MSTLEINKTHHMNCLDGLKLLEPNSVDLMVTSPPYFNAREYSQWSTFNEYMTEMKNIFTEVYRVLKNHKNIIVNVGDIVGQTEKQKWSTKKIPLGAKFICMLEDIGFEFIDDFIWDKGEPQSKRHLGNPPYPFYQYPVNCYEHILIFTKHQLNKNKIKCPICNKMEVVSNSQSKIGVQSWECKNEHCPEKSKSGRGKRFSERSIMMNDYKTIDNVICESLIKKWHRDIIKINPIIKINNKKENKIGHTAPFPIEIPEMAILFYSGKNDLIMDIFSGSGTTHLIAKKYNRNYIGFEIHKEYIDIENKRLEENYYKKDRKDKNI